MNALQLLFIDTMDYAFESVCVYICVYFCPAFSTFHAVPDGYLYINNGNSVFWGFRCAEQDVVVMSSVPGGPPGLCNARPLMSFSEKDIQDSHFIGKKGHVCEHFLIMTTEERRTTQKRKKITTSLRIYFRNIILLIYDRLSQDLYCCRIHFDCNMYIPLCH